MKSWRFLAATLLTLACGSTMAAEPRSIAGMVKASVLPQFEHFFAKLSAEKERTTIDGVRAFNGRDKFLPGKIAIGLSYLALDPNLDEAKREEYLRGYREIADMTVGMDNETWGIYYYVLALNRLKRAGLLERAISPATAAKLRAKLDWRTFVTTPDYRLIDLPNNYYGVAFSVARLRFLLGWEDETGAKDLLAQMLAHYRKFSGDYGFSDETDGEGRYDRYSILLIAEVCQRFIETGLTVTPELKELLRKSVTIAFEIASPTAEGFAFGRSIGAYGDTAVVEILSVAAYLDVLSADEKAIAYAYCARVFERYLQFWYDPAMRSVDLWGKGRRTDAYRGKYRILGENLSLLHQLASTSELWKRAGFGDRVPHEDVDAWLARTQPPFAMTWFSRGEHDRALAIVRDGKRVFNLLMVNGGTGQHDNSPYYPLPFANSIVAGVADSGAKNPQLLPKLTLADGTQLIPAAYIKEIRATTEAGRHVVTWRQDALDRLGARSPVADQRIQVETRYTFEPGRITRADRYTARAPVEVASLSLAFASFSTAPRVAGATTDFADGVVSRFEVKGIEGCKARALDNVEEFRSPTGPMRSLVECARERFSMKEPFEVQWSISYR